LAQLYVHHAAATSLIPQKFYRIAPCLRNGSHPLILRDTTYAVPAIWLAKIWHDLPGFTRELGPYVLVSAINCHLKQFAA
jgi:hypothetical protein